LREQVLRVDLLKQAICDLNHGLLRMRRGGVELERPLERVLDGALPTGVVAAVATAWPKLCLAVDAPRTTLGGMDPNDLAEFLRAMRQRLQPQDVGLPKGVTRRTPGLRRAEVVRLAHISVEYYTRLEQARSANPSRRVLGELARTLRLSPDERAHLFNLAGVAAELPTGPRSE
jgi:transcriptional regulator with XRE-family HTH domain